MNTVSKRMMIVVEQWFKAIIREEIRAVGKENSESLPVAEKKRELIDLLVSLEELTTIF